MASRHPTERPAGPSNSLRQKRGLAKELSDHARHLPQGTSEYIFQGIKAAQETYLRQREVFDNTQNASEFILFSCVSHEIFNQITESNLLVVSSYEHQRQFLVIRMPSAPHEEAGRQVDRLVTLKTAAMSLENQLHFLGHADVTGSNQTKCADCSYRPNDLPANRDSHWPTLVVEVGYCEGIAAQLEYDATWWLNDSSVDNGVQIVITINVNRQKYEITLRKWKRVPKPTRAQPQRMAPAVVHQTVISTPTADSPARVTASPFVLSFQKVFLRNPGPGEGDINFSEDDLKALANQVWAANQ